MDIAFLRSRMQNGDIPWSVSNKISSVSTSVVQRETTHVLNGVVESKLDVSNVLIPVLGSDASTVLQERLVIFCFWFLRAYVLCWHFVVGNRVNTDTCKGQLIRGKEFKIGG
jgi:hypothetical protein